MTPNTSTSTTAPDGSTRAACVPQLLDITAVASALGVETRHVRRLVAERRIPYVKWGHLIRFDPAELTDWINSARVRRHV